jgi:2'-5' RNA ligase
VRPNWFIALPARFELLLPAGARKFVPEDRHVTIAFLGGVGEARALAAWDALVWQEPMSVHLGKVERFGESALAATIREEELSRRIGAASVACFLAAGLELPKREALAHVTLARSKEEEKAIAWCAAADVEGTAVLLDEVALYTWAEPRSAARQFQIVRAKRL